MSLMIQIYTFIYKIAASCLQKTNYFREKMRILLMIYKYLTKESSISSFCDIQYIIDANQYYHVSFKTSSYRINTLT